MSHESSPLISVIVAVRNGRSTVQQCIDSVWQQTYAGKELIVIDGGSEDGTIDVLSGSRGKMAYLVSEPDRGIYHAWNKGLKQAKGEWVCFLGADDYFRDAQVLERVARNLKTLPDSIRIAYGQVMIVNASGETVCLAGSPWGQIRKRFRQIMCIPHTGVMHRRSLFERYGDFDESFRIAGDYEMLLRELKSADAFFIPDCTIAAMRAGGISSTPANSLLLMREIRRAARKHGQSFPGRFWTSAMTTLYIRLALWDLLGERRARKALDFARQALKGEPPFWTRT